MKNLDAILAPARAIIRPPKPEPKKNHRTYYLWDSGRVSQRKPKRGVDGIKAYTRATTTEDAFHQFVKTGHLFPSEGK